MDEGEEYVRAEAAGGGVGEAAEGGRSGPAPGTALCLSGGGYRAMLFHLGALWRLQELGYLADLRRVSSVSGGSITAAKLGLHFGQVTAPGTAGSQAFQECLVAPLRRLASRAIDPWALFGPFLPGGVAGRVAAAYRRHLFGSATLQALPDRPRFVFNATSVQSGALWRFSKPYMGDYHVGLIDEPQVELAVAVAASSAFPPFLSPLRLSVTPESFRPETRGDLYRHPYWRRVVLTDGGVYDNLGLETCFKRYETVLVSDGGGRLGLSPRPLGDWFSQSWRAFSIIQSQVRALRVRELLERFEAVTHSGAYWGTYTNIRDYGLHDALECPPCQTRALAQTSTRLWPLDDRRQERLINWGYAVCDAAMRSRMQASGPTRRFPYPDSGVG